MVFLGACAATPPGASAVAVPAERAHAYGEKPQGPDFGTVIFTRDSSMIGAALAMKMSIDGKPVADARSGERATLYVPAGEHIVSAKSGVNPRKDVEAVVKPGATRYCRLTIHDSGVTDIDPTLPDGE
ncbi:hypothetical protein [Paraburkholderia sp. DHOC27]|uniref:hypothetical protein n=1 Tax=Paraburkholderia sp. DHOC27 TaxID=2303330 RepID=UPI000E3E1F2F|nr:hypothetical protein [Paraburkholderia sp. DHOC27]RFU43990.1 hypothetical protein D0B32_30875 [Paraburkholderia sp. DHOC27]